MGLDYITSLGEKKGQVTAKHDKRIANINSKKYKSGSLFDEVNERDLAGDELDILLRDECCGEVSVKGRFWDCRISAVV